MSCDLINRDASYHAQLIRRCFSAADPEKPHLTRIGGIPTAEAALVSHLIPSDQIPAAVLVPIVDRPEGLTLLMTQRSSRLRTHAGQISFPGGRIEPKDGGPKAAALRETEEEIGLSGDQIEIVGQLSSHCVFSGFAVTPVIGLVKPDFSLCVDSREVESVFEVPLSYVLNPNNQQLEQRTVGECSVSVYFFQYGYRRIWGLTAGIIMHLHERLRAES